MIKKGSMYSPRLPTQEEMERAIDHLAQHLDKDLLKLAKSLLEKERTLITYHLTFGMQVRNFLRDGGFKWSDQVFDGLWERLVRETIMKCIPLMDT